VIFRAFLLFYAAGSSLQAANSFQEVGRRINNLTLETERCGANLIVSIDGELDLETAPVFRDTVDKKLNQYDSVRHLILDLEKVSFIDSSGLGAILGRFKRLNQQGGRLSAIRVSRQILRVLELSGLLRIMKIYDDRRQALDS
jgi:stage II sporulation protein AA (anti-sigma F factor antagonist)